MVAGFGTQEKNQKPVRARGGESEELYALEPDVRLSVVGRVAYLEGRVSCYERKKALARLALEMPLVGRVVNRLRVAPGSLRPDETIERDVQAALKMDPRLRQERISVRVKDGVVEMRGTVAGIAARIAAEAAAWAACGVHDVDSRLELSSPQHNSLSSLGRSA